MKSLSIWILSAAAAMLPLQAMAQAATVGNGSGIAGDVLVIPVTFEAGATALSGIDLDITFDATQFSAATASCGANDACSGAFVNCSVDPAGTANIIVAASSACTSGTLGEITLTIDAAATAGDKPLTLTVVGASDPDGQDIPTDSVGATDGNVAVLGAAYSSNPAPGLIALSGKQNEADPAQDLVISNVGVDGTTLTVDCGRTSDPDGVFAILPNTSFDVAKGESATATYTVSCDATAALTNGVPYVGEISCLHNGDSTGEADPAIYPLTCDILDKDPAEYADNPDSGSTVDITAGMDVKEGDQEPISEPPLMIANVAAVDAHLLNLYCENSGPITASRTGSFGMGGQADTSVVFTCPTDIGADTFSTTYSCNYTEDGTDPSTDLTTPDSMWTYTCDVRAPEATVEPSPASGLPPQLAQPGGTVTYDVVFGEVGGEGVAGQLETCSLGTGAPFAITSPASFPQDILADGSVTVTVTGTDPGGIESATDTLTCTYLDGPDSNVSHDVTYNLVMDIGGQDIQRRSSRKCRSDTHL